MGTKFKYTWESWANTQNEVRIKQSGYSGDPTILQPGGQPFRLTWGQQGEQDLTKPLLVSTARLQFVGDSEGSLVEEVFDGGDTEYTVQYVVDGTLEWQGFLATDLWQDNPNTDFETIELEAIDGLALLESQPQSLDVSTTVMQGIREVLPHGLPLEVNCEWYPNDADLTADDLVLDNISLFKSAFADVEDIGDTKGSEFSFDDTDVYGIPENVSGINRREQLEELLDRFSLQLFQAGGKWHVRQRHRIDDSTGQLKVWEKDTFGNTSGPTTRDLTKTLGDHRRQEKPRSRVQRLRSAKSVYDFGELGDILRNPDFETGDLSNWTVTTENPDNLEGPTGGSVLNYDNTTLPQNSTQTNTYVSRLDVTAKGSLGTTTTLKQETPFSIGELPRGSINIQFDYGKFFDSTSASFSDPQVADPQQDLVTVNVGDYYLGHNYIEVTEDTEASGDEPGDIPVYPKFGGQSSKKLLVPEGTKCVVVNPDSSTGTLTYPEQVTTLTTTRPIQTGDEAVEADFGSDIPGGSHIIFYQWYSVDSTIGENYLPTRVGQTYEQMIGQELDAPLFTPTGEKVSGKLTFTVFVDGSQFNIDDTQFVDAKYFVDGVDVTIQNAGEEVSTRSFLALDDQFGREVEITNTIGDGPTYDHPRTLWVTNKNFYLTRDWQEGSPPSGPTDTFLGELVATAAMREHRGTLDRRTYTLELRGDTDLSPEYVYEIDGTLYTPTYIDYRAQASGDNAVVEFTELRDFGTAGLNVGSVISSDSGGGSRGGSGSTTFIGNQTVEGGASSWDQITGKPSLVNTFEGREGDISLQSADVTGALGYTPYEEGTDLSAASADLTGDLDVSGTITGDNTIGKSLTVNGSFHSKGKIKVGQDVAVPSYAAGIIKPDPTDALSLLVVEAAQAGEKAGLINSLAGTGHQYEYAAGEFDSNGDGSYDNSSASFRSRTNDGWADPIRIDINSDDSVQAVFNGGSEAGTNASLLKPLFKDGLIAEGSVTVNSNLSVSGNTTTTSLNAGILSVSNNSVNDTTELSVGYNQNIKLTTGSFGELILDPVGAVDVKSYITVGNGSPGFTSSGTQIQGNVAWFDDVNVRGTLYASEFEVRKIDVARGEKIFGPGGGKITELYGDQTYDAKWRFEEETGIQVGDVLLIKEVNASDNQIAKEVYAVAKEVNDKTKRIKVNINGTQSAGSAEVGDDVAVIGSSDPQRDSFVYLNPFGPYIDVLDGIGSVSDWQSRSPNVRMGNLDGAPTLSDGTNPTGRGFYASGNAYLEGTVVADSGELGGWTIEDNVIKNPDVNGTGATITIGQRNSSWYGYHIAGPNGVETYNQVNQSSGRIVQGLYANGGADKIEWGNESGVNGGLGIQIVANNNFILRTDEDGTAYVDNLEVRSNAIVGGTQASNLASQSEIFSGNYSDLSGTPSIPDGALAELDKINDTTLIGNGVIITDMIASDAIVSDKIAANAVTATQIGVGSVKDIDSNAAVASDLFSGDYSDLSGTPTLGTLSSLDKITDSTYIGDGVIVTSKIAVDTALANDILAKNASITNTLTMGTSGEITNSGGDWSVDSDGFTVQQGTYRRNSYDIVDSTNSRVATFSANSNNVDLISDNGTMAVRSDEKLTLNSINGDIRLDPQFGGKTEFMGTSSIKAEMKPYDGDTNSVSYKGMMLVFNNPIPESNLSDSLVRENLNIGEGAISAISFSDGNVNLLWMERDENDNVFYDWIF